MPAMKHSPLIGSQVDVDGSVFVFYYGVVIAICNKLGEIVWRSPNYPLYVVEYVLKLPDPDAYRWN